MKKVIWIITIILLSFGCTSTNTEENRSNACSAETVGHEWQELVNVVAKYKAQRWTVLKDYFNDEVTAYSTPPSPGVNTDNGPTLEDLNNLLPVKNQDARVIWFSLNSIKQFICTIEKYRDSIDGVNPDDLGIMMFYGVYNKDQALYKNMHTIFMLPTLEVDSAGVKITKLVDLRANTKLGKKQVNQLDDMFTTSDSLLALTGFYSLMLSLTESNGSPTIKNNGDLGPPKFKDILTRMDSE